MLAAHPIVIPSPSSVFPSFGNHCNVSVLDLIKRFSLPLIVNLGGFLPNSWAGSLFRLTVQSVSFFVGAAGVKFWGCCLG